MRAADGADLALRLREAGEEELSALVEEGRERFGLAEAQAVLRNPFVTGEILEQVASVRTLVGHYGVRRDIAAHPRTPRTLALRFVSGLFWRDLAAIAADSRLHPVVRRSAERRLLERLPGLAVGEKISLARRASVAIVAALRLDPSPRVVSALLENPRLTEAQLLPLASHERASPRCLAVLSATPRWATRRAIRSALCRNPATPVASSTRLVSGLTRDDLMAVNADPRLPAALRERAAALAGRRGRRGGGRA